MGYISEKLQKLRVILPLGCGVEKDWKEDFRRYLKSTELGELYVKTRLVFAYKKGSLWLNIINKHSIGLRKLMYYDIIGYALFSWDWNRTK